MFYTYSLAKKKHKHLTLQLKQLMFKCDNVTELLIRFHVICLKFCSRYKLQNGKRLMNYIIRNVQKITWTGLCAKIILQYDNYCIVGKSELYLMVIISCWNGFEFNYNYHIHESEWYCKEKTFRLINCYFTSYKRCQKWNLCNS